MFKIFTSLLLLILGLGSFAQTKVGSVDPTTKGLSLESGPRGKIQGMKLEAPKLTGNTFSEEDWCLGSLTLVNGHKIEKCPLKYDIANYAILILDESTNQIKSLSGVWVDNINWYNFTIKNYQKYSNSYLFGSGIENSFVEVLYQGDEYSLVSNYVLKIVKGTYVPAIDLGERQRKITKVKKHYLVKDKHFMEIPNSKKKLAKLLSESALLPFIQSNKINLNSATDLIKVAEFLNEN